MSNNKLYYNRMIEVLKLLASDADTQIKSFPQLVHVPDEIALAFDDAYFFLGNIKSAGVINDMHISKLDNLNFHLDEMSDNKSLWNLDALGNADEWKDVRKLAFEILSLFGERLVKPNLNWMSFVKQDEIP